MGSCARFALENNTFSAASMTSAAIFEYPPGTKGSGLQAQEWIKKYGENAYAPKWIISDKTSDEMQVLADGALYYQTSMGPQFVLAGIPVVQVGHKTYEDVLVRGKLCSSVTDSTNFVQSITAMKPTVVTEEQKKLIFTSLGIKDNWFETLKQVIDN